MLITPTLDKLRALNLTGMARALTEQLERADYQVLSFEDRLGLMVDREAQDRDNRRLDRYLKAAKLRAAACVEDIDFRRSRGLERSLVLSLAEAEWVTGHRNVLIVGPTGVGKTFVACALAQAAVRRAHTALYLRAPRLLSELALARADGRLPRLMTRWAKVDVLVIDDLALRPLAAEQAADLLEVIEDRHQLRSTIVTSQLPVTDGTTHSASPPSLTPSSIGWSTTLTASSCAASRCARLRPPTSPLLRRIRPQKVSSRANGGTAPRPATLRRPERPGDDCP